MLLSQLNSTGDCIKVAKTLTLDEVEELIHAREICKTSARKWMDVEAWDLSMIMATKAQFCREAIQHSIHYDV